MSDALTCPDCGQTYAPISGHCRGGRYEGCCSSFATSGGFDAHRTKGRCLTREERSEAGWWQDLRGYWHVPGGFHDSDEVFA